MGLFEFFKAPLPEVPVTEDTSELVHVRVRAMAEGPLPQRAGDELRALIEEDLYAITPEFIEQLGVERDEVTMELVLLAWVAFCQAVEEEDAGSREQALELLEPYAATVREYVAFGHRERYDAGPGPILSVADKLAVGGRDPRHIVLGFLPTRLGVRARRGAVEGLMRLAVLAQMGGYGIGKLAWKDQS
ncbi:MAG: hypothetical protein GY913_24040 [Proteobacteria bacterium]|nr:hypothetical protein [Pseudomonadota bacterium]MCP4919985.1 hypothetical protein [Pseudomonadota bacterium]